jgi:two-component system, cell cycle sensor histidine kinase and response regulator CckA
MIPQMTNAAIRILVVDDEPAVLTMVGVYLRRLGYTVVTAASTEKAWKEVEAAPHAFAVAVLDATMRGMPMEELAAGILGADLKVCVIVASGYPADIGKLHAVAPGRVAFLHKPFSPEMLGSLVRRMSATQEEGV